MTSRAAVVVCAMSLASVSMQAQSPPDFSGVYRPINAFGPAPAGRDGAPPPAPRAGGPAPGQPLPPPTRTAPLSDGSRGRAANAPKLTPEYLAKWQAISKARVAGDSSSDNTLKCLPPGMPAMMNMAYGMEVMHTKDKITFFSELNDALRRVYLDGRKPTQLVLDDPTYAGFSTGHWEGDTLVVDVTNFTDETNFHGARENLHVILKFKRVDAKTLSMQFTAEDPMTWTRPWTAVQELEKADDKTTLVLEGGCHEGNYGLTGLLINTRAAEKAFREGKGPDPATQDNATGGGDN